LKENLVKVRNKAIKGVSLTCLVGIIIPIFSIAF